jgi:hypothetical protein
VSTRDIALAKTLILAEVERLEDALEMESEIARALEYDNALLRAAVKRILEPGAGYDLSAWKQLRAVLGVAEEKVV